MKNVIEKTRTANTKKRYTRINILVFLAVCFILGFNVATKNPETEKQKMQMIEKTLSDGLDQDMKRIITEDLIDYHFDNSKGKELIIGKQFDYPTHSWVVMKLDVLRFIMRYHKCLNQDDMDALCTIWRMIKNFNPPRRNLRLQRLRSDWLNRLEDLIRQQLMCQPDFDIEEQCKNKS